MKTHQENVNPTPEETVEIIHQAILKKDFNVVLDIIRPLKRKADFWDMADKFFHKYGYNFRFEIRKEGSEEQNSKLAEFENRLYNSY